MTRIVAALLILLAFGVAADTLRTPFADRIQARLNAGVVL